jgi:gluconolactonase
MLRSPENFSHRTLVCSISRSAIAGLFCMTFGLAQDFGTAELPADLVAPGTKVIGVLQKAPGLNRDMKYSEGPACDAEGNVFFTEDESGSSANIWKVSATGQASNFYKGPGMPNGLEFDKDGKMYSAELASIAVYNKTSVSTKLSMSVALDAGTRINDLTLASNGGMFFTNHAKDFYYRSPTGVVTVYRSGTDAMGAPVPNGAEYIEEKKLLYVTSDGDKKVYLYDVADDGKISGKRAFATVDEPDGITLDEKGNVYVASYNLGAIRVFDPTGKDLGKIAIKGTTTAGNASNCIIGGPDNKTLFITGNQGLFKVQLKVGPRVRPGTTTLRHGLLSAPVAPAIGLSDVHNLLGRKVEMRQPAALVFLISRINK